MTRFSELDLSRFPPGIQNLRTLGRLSVQGQHVAAQHSRETGMVG